MRIRDYETRNISIEARDEMRNGSSLKAYGKIFPGSFVSITSLKVRLSKVLLEQTRNKLPSLIEEIEARVQETQKVLNKLVQTEPRSISRGCFSLI